MVMIKKLLRYAVNYIFVSYSWSYGKKRKSNTVNSPNRKILVSGNSIAMQGTSEVLKLGVNDICRPWKSAKF